MTLLERRNQLRALRLEIRDEIERREMRGANTDELEEEYQEVCKQLRKVYREAEQAGLTA